MASWPDFRVGELLRRLVDGGVDFVVVGGVAVVLHATPRFTKDLDVCYSPEPANLQALGEVLVALDARLRGIDDDLPFVPGDRTLRRTQILTLNTTAGGLDLLLAPAGAPDYATLRARADVMEIEGRPVPVASIDDLLSMKLAAGRPQDLVDVEALEIARRRRGARGR